MAIELGAYYVSVVPSMRGAAGQIQSQMSGIDMSKPGSTLGKQMSSSLVKGLDMQAVGAKIQSFGNSISGVGEKMTNAITKPVLLATGAAAAGLAVVGRSALNAYGTWEQAVGGVETLFKDNASTIMKYADAAYKTAGISANDYMNQVTSFSASLLQGLGGDTAKAAETANRAVEDMSDNANKFGSNITDIQNAYQGFAKQNYTMLDNLKLGYGGTKSEMERLLADAQKISGVEYNLDNFNDVIDAIHVIQQEMGVTGTTSLEAATTIEGSVGMMKAAWTNWLTEIGKTDGDVALVTEQLMESIGIALGNIIPRVKQIFEGIVESIPVMFQALREQLPAEFQPALDKIQELADRWQALSPETKKLVGQFALAVVALGPALQVVGKLVSGVGGLATWVGKLAPAFGGAAGGAGGLLAKLGRFAGPIGIAIAAIAALWTQSEGFREGIKTVATTVWDVATQIWDALAPVFQQLGEVIWPVIEEIGELLGGILTEMSPLFQSLGDSFAGLIEAAQPFLDWLTNNLQVGLENIMTVVRAVFEALGPIIEAQFAILSGILSAFTALFRGDWDGFMTGLLDAFWAGWDLIKAVFFGAVDVIWTVLSGWIETVKGAWTAAWTAISSFVSSTWETIKATVSAAIMVVQATIRAVVSSISATWTATWNAVRTFFSQIWEGIKSAARAGVDNVYNTVVGIKTRIVSFFAGAGMWLWNAGKAIVQGLIDGIKAMASSVTSAVSGVMSAARNLLPFSPAKEGPFSGKGWTLYSGMSIMEALAEGVTAKEDAFTSAVAGAMAGGQSAIRDLTSGNLRLMSAPLGYTLAFNGTGRPEPVFTGSQWDLLRERGLTALLSDRQIQVLADAFEKGTSRVVTDASAPVSRVGLQSRLGVL